MFFFLMKLFLRKAFPIPLAWSFAYPTITGDVAIRGIRIGKPALFTVDSAKLSPAWSSVFSDELRIESLRSRGIAGAFSVADPTRLLECLAGGPCVRGVSCEPGAEQFPVSNPKTVAADAEPKQTKEPLRIFVENLRAEDGALTFCRGTEKVQLRVLRADISNLRIPIPREGFVVSADVQLEEGKSGKTSTSKPVHGTLQWNAQSRVLSIHASLDDFPLLPLARLFPEQVHMPKSGGVSMPFTIGKQTVVQEIHQAVTASGDLELRYDPAKAPDSRWTIRLP